MSIGRKLKNTFKKFYVGYFCHIYRKQYAYKLKVNHLNTPPHTDGERKWLDYWKQLGVDPLKETYRTFYHYMGDSLSIVPETTCHYVVEPILNPVKMQGFYSDKNFFEKILPQGFLPQALLRKIRGHYYDADYRFINLDEEKFQTILAQCGSERIIVKPSVESCSGNGVELFVKTDDGCFCHIKKQTRLTKEWLEQNAGSNFIMQEAVVQSDFMSRFCRTSVNTLRIAVYRSVKDDECYVLASIMRIGSDGSYLDNAHAGGRFVGISRDGVLGKYVMDQYGTKQNVFNGIDFSQETFEVPNFSKIKAFAIEVGKHVPHHRLLALDVAIKKDGSPVLLEYNIDGYGMWVFQFTGVSALGDYAAEIHDYCLQHLSESVQAIYI